MPSGPGSTRGVAAPEAASASSPSVTIPIAWELILFGADEFVAARAQIPPSIAGELAALKKTDLGGGVGDIPITENLFMSPSAQGIDSRREPSETGTGSTLLGQSPVA